MAYNFQTFGNVVDDAYAEMSLSSGNTVAGLSQTQMESWANRFSKIFIEKCKLKTQEATTSFRTIGDKALAADASSGAVSITLDSVTSMPSSGSILLDGIPVTYSAVDPVTLAVTVSALSRAFSSGDGVQVGYAIPTNFGKPRSLFLDGSSDMFPQLGGVRYELQKWGTAEEILSNRYAIYGDYIFLPKALSAGSDVTLHYYKKATDTLTAASTNEIYQMWDNYVISRLVARGYRLLNDLSMAQTYENLAFETLRAAKQQVAEEDLSINRAFIPGF